MIKHKNQRVGVFVDVQNMYYSAKNLFHAKVNFGAILKAAVGERELIRALAYVIKASAPEEQSFFEALDKQGFELQMKDLQVFYGGHKKGDWDIGMAVDAIRLADRLDAVVLVTGDGDFAPLIDYLKYNRGCQVEVMAFTESASSSLKELADEFTDLSGNRQRFLMKKMARMARKIKTTK
ncbi:NYN domain-containing protein [Patescibacteria group bacterium]|nr:NYN domain-containing protein [Patescibacteria group bacterium]